MKTVPPSRKGSTMSEESRHLISIANKGKVLSEEHKTKISIAKKGLPGRKKTEEEKIKISETMKRLGIKPIFHPDNRGSKSGLWKGGITSVHTLIRRSKKYQQWRKSVFERDNYTCQICNRRGIILNADHIKPFSLFEELRFVLSNGRTLCVDCHKKHGWKGSHICKR